MPIGVSSVQWDMRIPWGSNVQWAFNMFQPGGITPYTISGHTFAYVVRAAPASSELVIAISSDGELGPTPAGAGELTLSSTPMLSSVVLSLYPAATSALTPPLTYYHALWMDYDNPSTARNLFWGSFLVDPAVQV